MKRSSISTKMALFLALFIVFGTVMMQAQNPTDVTGYETVSVSIPATSYNASAGAPQMAPVKYNKQFPLVITSDDMGKTELTNNWAEINGYPNLNDGVNLGIQPGGTAFLQAPLKKYYTQGQSQDADDYAPMTYTDNVGKTQRYRMTSAIMPYELANNSYDKINANDAKLMLRTGFSFAQHDVEDISSVANITAKLKTNSDKWAQKVGIGLKVMVEPNGNHEYLAAAKESDEMCWSIFQNNTSEYPFNSLALADWTHSRSNWATVSTEAPTNFNTKPMGGYQRTFFQGHESEWQSEVNSADGTKILIGGTHGLGNTIKDFIRTSDKVKNNAWVAAADEVWEYYHIYNNVKIENVNWDGSNLTFDVQVPTYKKNQFRELTLNIPGLTGGSAPAFSTASGKSVPVTGGFNATGGSGIGYTMNLGMENSITSYIDQLMTIYRDDQNNAFVKRDLEYLINQLWDGATKNGYTTQLNAAPAHIYNIVANTGETLYTGRTDANGTPQHAVPRYILSGTTLYETEPNASNPNYVKSVSTTEATTTVQYTAKDLSSLAVAGTPKAALFVEGEDLEGVAVVGADYDFNTTSAGRYWAMVTSSGAMGGSVISGKPVTITSSLPRGKYKMVIGYGEAYKNQGTYTYTVSAGDTQIYSFNNSTATNQAVTEFTSAEFSIETGGTAITISSNFSPEMPEQSSRWIDYVYFVKTGSLDPTVTLTSSKTSPMAGTNVILTAKAMPGSSNNTVTYLAIEQEVNGGWTSVGDPYSAPSAARGTGIRRVASQDPTTGEVTVTYLFPAGTNGTSYNFRANATISDGVNAPTTLLSTDDAESGGQGQTLQLTSVENTATTYKYHLLNASGTEVAYCENTEFGLPANMRSPLVEHVKVWSDVNKTTEYTNTTGMVFGNDYYVTYDLTPTGQELFAGGKYKIFTTLNSGKYVNKANGTDDRVGPYGNDFNNIWRISGDPYSLQISMADDPTKKISFANYINGSQCTASASNPYNTFIILGSGNSDNPYVLRLNEGEAHYEQDKLSVVDLVNGPFALWRLSVNNNDYKSKRFRFEKQNIYTYHIIDAGGNDVLQSETNSSTLSIPANINSPWCTLKSFSTLANAQAYTASGDDSDELVGSTLSVNEVYIGYQVKSEYQKYFDIMSPQYFTLKINNTQMYSQSSNNGAYNSGTGTNNKYWYMTGDPYNVRLYNEQKKAIGPQSFSTMPAVDSSADMSFGSGTYQTFAILNATNTSPSTLWAFRASGSGITTQEVYINLGGNTLKAWRTDLRTNGGNAITLTDTQIATTYTYKIYNAIGTLMAEGTREQAASATPLVPDAITSPLVTAYTYYVTEVDAQTASGTPLATVGDATSNTIYVRYTYDNEFFNHEYRINNGTNYSFAHNATVIFNSWSGNSYPHPDIWTFSGDPYSAQIHPYSNSGMTVGNNTESNGQKLFLNANPTYSHWMILGTGNGSYKLQINNKVDGGSTTVYYDQPSNSNSDAKMTTTETTIQIRRPVKYTFVNAANPLFDALVFFDGIAGSGDALGLRSDYANRLFGIANHTTYYSDRAGTTAKTTAETGLYEVFVRYTTDTSALLEKGITFSTDYASAIWMTLAPRMYNSGDRSIYLKRSGTSMTSDSNADNASLFAFIGDPLRFDVVTNDDNKEIIGTALTFADATGGRLWTMTNPYGSATDDYAAADPRFRIVRAKGTVGDMTTLGALTPAQRHFWHIPSSNVPQLWSYDTGTSSSHSETSEFNNIVATSPSRMVTFRIYDSEDHAMLLNGTPITQMVAGVPDNASWATLFNTTNLPRQYCTYTFYTDDTFATETTNDDGEGYVNSQKDIYVKWNYTADAPVFSSGTDASKYQYYVFANRAAIDGYNTYNDGGVTTKLAAGKYNPDNKTQIGYDQYVDKENSQWALVGNPYDFALYNRVGKYLRLADGATIANNQPVGFTETVSGALSWCLPLVDWTDENQALSDRVNREADAFRLFYPKINGYNVGLGNTQLNAGSDNIRWGFKRIEYIVVPLTVYDGSMTVKDEQEYSVPYPETSGRVIDGDKMIRGTYHTPNLKHGFCDYTYYDTYTTGTPATLSGKMPAGGFDACGGTEQKKKEVYATYTVDEEMFLQPWLTYNITDGTKQHYSLIDDSHVQESMQTEAAIARQDTSKKYQWVFKGDPYNFQIANVSMGETETTALYPLGAKETGWEISENRYLHVTNDTETYHYNTFEIVEAEQSGDDGSGKYSITLIHSGIDRYKGGIVYPKDGMMQMRTDAYADTWLTPVVEQYNIVWQVIDGSGSNVLWKTVKNQYDGKVIRPSDMPEDLKRHFCDYTFYYAANNAAYVEGTTPAMTDAGVAIHGAYTIYAKYTLDSGAPEFMSAVPTSSSGVDNKYWHEIHYPSSNRLIMRGASTTNVTFDNLNDSRTIADVRNEGENYFKYCWALVGTPYGVKFYNRDAQQYLTTDGTTLSLSATGTTFNLMDDVTGDLCDIFDCTTETYVTSQATVSPEAYRFPSYQNTSAEFTNTDGLVKITFVLHYSDKTLRQKDSDNNGTLDADAKNTTQDIVITTFQKKGKALANVLPTMWKRAFCDYTYHWNNSNRHDEMANDAVTNINDDMVAVYNNGTTDIYVHVTYDFKTTAPFKWSSTTTDRNGKYWYYMVNNHYQAGEQGRMVRRGSSPTLLVNTGLKEENKYLSYFEWCVIGDPYGFKMLNRYDPDQRYDQYISVTNENDESNAGKLIEQQAGNGNCIFEMMPGQYNYNFWMHPIYTSALKDETSDEMSYVGHNYNGSAAIIPTTKATVKTLTTNSAANFRLEIQTTESLADYVKYAGFVGGLKYDKTTSELRAAATAGTLSAEQKAEIRTLIDNPEENIVLMKQGYYRMVPLNKETTTAHTYVRGYLDEREKTASGGFNKKLKMEDQTSAESDPASIFWFEGTTVHDNDANKDFPRYYVRTQGLNLSDNSLTDEEGYKTCYEDLGGAMMQLKVKNEDANPYTYLNCSKTSTEISLDRCFGHPWSDFNTSFYLQPVGTGGGEMPLKANLGKGHNGSPTLNQSLSNLPYTYKSFCVPYDLQVVGGHDKDGNPLTADQCDMMPFIGLVEHHHTTKSETSDTYYNADEYALYCESIDEHQRVDDWKNSNLYIPAGTPVILRSCSGMTDVTFVIPTDAPSTATAANQLTENCLKGNYIKKSDTNEQIRLFGKESVIHEGNWVYTGRVGLFARANPEMMLPSNSLYYVEPVRGSSASASSAQASNTRTMLAFGRIGNYLVTLNDAQANTATIEQNNEHKADITLSGRKLYKDGDWNTICLPFTLEDGDDSDDISFSGTVIEGATVMELDTDGDHNGYQTGYDSEAGTLYLFFKTAETIEAGKAYLIKWETGDNDDVEVLQSPTFNDVVITGSAQTTVTASNSGLNTVQFVGNYDPVTLTAGDKTKFYLGSNNQLYWPKTDVTLNAFRGYFVVDLGNDVNGVRAYSLGFGDEETTGVALMDNGELIIDSKAGAWYDLGGRKLNGKPTQKGVYIYNGKKRVVK